MIDYKKVLGRANVLYRWVRGRDIESEQIKALARALVEAVNAELCRLDYEREIAHRAG
jgi:hypothetical protein